jgi:predicted ATP-grasp superfamily ATP-dependent carboligase
LHPKQRVKFSNNDQSLHPVKVYVSNELIHFDQSLTPGHVYDLPECIVHYLSEKGYPVWSWVTGKDGEKETRQTGKKSRFSLTTIYQGDY